MLKPTYKEKIPEGKQKTYKKKLLKLFFLRSLNDLLRELVSVQLSTQFKDHVMKEYAMDNKIVQFLVNSILETGAYTLEGIARYTRIPFDVIYDAACGINHAFSITPWSRIVELYLEVKPEVAQLLFEKLLEAKDQGRLGIASLLQE